MANIEQKRADLEKALAALDENEIEAVAGGLSDKGKKILKGVGIGAGIIVGGGVLAGTGYGLYRHFKGKKEVPEAAPTIDHSKPISGGNSYGFIPDYSKNEEIHWGPTKEEQNQDEFNTNWD